MLEFLALKPETFSLDISDLSLKIVKLKKEAKTLDLVSFGEMPIELGILKEGEIRKEKELTALIKKGLDKVRGEKLKTNYVIASLPEEKAFLEVIQMPKMSREDLKSAVIYEAENYIPLPIEDVYLDSQVILPISNHLDHQDVLIAALPKKTVDSYLNCLKGAGLQPLALEIESLAIARALIKDGVSNYPILLIDLGATRTSFIIFSGRALRFTFFIPVSAQKLTEAISQTMGVELAEAEKLKLEYGIETKATKEGGQVFEALIPSLTDLTEQIKKYLDYYQTHSAHEHLPQKVKEVKQVLLCGGGANLKGLPEYFSEQLKIPVSLGNPWINILPEAKKSISGMKFEDSLRFTTALGLALRGIDAQ